MRIPDDTGAWIRLS